MTTLAKYQGEVVDGLAGVLRQGKSCSISLVSPTGSGKTLMLARALDEASSAGGVPSVWIWLAPFEAIVTQTAATITKETKNLIPRALDVERRFTGFVSGEVFLATAQLVSNSAASIHKREDKIPTLEQMAAAIRQNFKLGIVLDEAHIGVDADTALGRRIAALRPDFILAASATPKDARLATMLAAAGAPAPRTITISRQDVVAAGLNKERLVAMRIIADNDDPLARELGTRAMVHHAVRCRSGVEQVLRRNGSDMVPLILAQADNGDESAHRIEQELIGAGLPAACIGKYLNTEKPDGPLAELAANPSIAAIIFKVAAGTGFDAPRACILLSDRTVQDKDTAVQFVGRIMRLPRDVRKMEQDSAAGKDDLRVLKTAYLFTRDSERQEAFREAATLLRALATEIDFTEQGFQVINAYVPSGGDMPPPSSGTPGQPQERLRAEPTPHIGPLFGFGSSDKDLQSIRLVGDSALLLGAFGLTPDATGTSHAKPAKRMGPNLAGYESNADLDADLKQQGLMAWRLRTFDRHPVQFWQEDWPLLEDHDKFLARLGKAFKPSQEDVDTLISTARGEWKATARFEDFFFDDVEYSSFSVTDLPTIARIAEQNARKHLGSLRTLSDSGAQDEILEAIRQKLARMDLKLPDFELNVLARLAVPLAMPKLREEEAVFLSSDVRVEPGMKLPDLIVVPQDLPRRNSQRSVYGLLPPSKEELQNAAPGLAETLAAWDNVTIKVNDKDVRVERVDQSLATNFSESLLIEILDQVDGVRWWGRNPDQKSWSARVLRIDGKGRFFYPDFVVNLDDRESSKMQLIETKHDTLDIEAKQRRGFTPSYGKVLFLFTDGQSLRLLSPDGRPGRQIPTNDKGRLVEALRKAAVSDIA